MPDTEQGSGMLDDVMVNVDKTREDVHLAVVHLQLPNFKYTLTLHLYQAPILDSLIQVKKALEDLIGEVERAVQRGDGHLSLPTSANLSKKPQQIIIPGNIEEVLRVLGGQA